MKELSWLVRQDNRTFKRRTRFAQVARVAIDDMYNQYIKVRETRKELFYDDLLDMRGRTIEVEDGQEKSIEWGERSGSNQPPTLRSFGQESDPDDWDDERDGGDSSNDEDDEGDEEADSDDWDSEGGHLEFRRPL